MSKVGIGALVTLLMTVLALFGIQVPAELGGQVTDAIATLIGLVMLVWGQLDRKDLKFGLVRRK